jgi:hypothetical protein
MSHGCKQILAPYLMLMNLAAPASPHLGFELLFPLLPLLLSQLLKLSLLRLPASRDE